jgi:hypothetical protein
MELDIMVADGLLKIDDRKNGEPLYSATPKGAHLVSN